MRIVYSDQYDLNLGDHVFPSVKYKLTKQRLLADAVARSEDFVQPEPATDEDVALVHHREYIRKLKEGKLSHVEILRLEIPYSPELVRAVWLAAGGSILAGRVALEGAVAVNLGGGFHHAFPDHGEGFCLIHDVAVAIRKMQKERKIVRAMVVDCDVHQGNGTAAIFRKDPEVFTLSIHQSNNYPAWKPAGALDIDLVDGVEDAEYLEKLQEGLESSLRRFAPDLLFYVAGADPYEEDQLGGLRLTLEGLVTRDRLVLGAARARGIPAHITLAGGYAADVEDTVSIHANTVRVAKEIFEA